jgi:hypothetical protein
LLSPFIPPPSSTEDDDEDEEEDEEEYDDENETLNRYAPKAEGGTACPTFGTRVAATGTNGGGSADPVI